MNQNNISNLITKPITSSIRTTHTMIIEDLLIMEAILIHEILVFEFYLRPLNFSSVLNAYMKSYGSHSSTSLKV